MDHFWELLTASTKLESPNLADTSEFPPLNAVISDKKTLIQEFRGLSEHLLVGMLSKMNDQDPEAEDLKFTLLSDPVNVSRIIKSLAAARENLLKHFLSLEKSKPGFILTLTQRYHSASDLMAQQPDYHLFGFYNNLQFGTFLVQAGFYVESLVILQIAKRQAGTRIFELLKTLPVALVAETLSGQHLAVQNTILDIADMIQVPDLPLNTQIDIHNALALSYFEQCQFESGRREAQFALELLDMSKSSSEAVITMLRMLGKCCLALRQTHQAKLLLTQAVSWAWNIYGTVSATYAAALEDYALYLLAMNAYSDSAKTANEAKDIYFELYGHLALQPAYAQGNLAFRLLLECCEFSEVQSIDRYMEFIMDIGNDQPVPTGTEDRQMHAFNRIPTLIMAANFAHNYKSSDDEREDELEDIHTRLTLDDIRMLYFTLFVDKRQLQTA